MSYTVYTTTLIGLAVGWDKLDKVLYTPVTRRGCEHAAHAGKFCPVCGKPAWIPSNLVHPELTEDSHGQSLFGFRILKNGDPRGPLPVCLAAEVFETLRPQNKETLFIPFEGLFERVKKAQDDMQRKLEPTGLWDYSKFGIHIFVEESG